MRLTVNGRLVDFYLAGAMATALGVSRDSMLRLEARGVIPRTPLALPGDWPEKGTARLYPCRMVLRTALWIDEAGLLGKRLSYHQSEVREALRLIWGEELHAIGVPLHQGTSTHTSA